MTLTALLNASIARYAKTADCKAAGLAVRAKDTGRVLMLQRSMAEDDPAAGTWEFPGGHLESGESPIQAARREWSEEIGQKAPRGKSAAEWQHGVYRGFVVDVPSESSVFINADGDDRKVLNPDDPDGDEIEVVAWWDPEQLKSNPAVRSELRAAMRQVQQAITGREKYARKPASGQMSLFDESKHPREPKGSSKGGQFASGVSGDAGPAGLTKQQAITEAASDSKSPKLNYTKAKQATWTYLGQSPADWNAVEVKGMAEVDTDAGARSMPEFEMPEGYKQVETPWSDENVCHLCGAKIKDAYHIQNDDQKQTMLVGSECVTHFGEGKSGKRLAKESQWKANRDLLGQAWDMWQALTDEFGTQRTNAVEGAGSKFWEYQPGRSRLSEVNRFGERFNQAADAMAILQNALFQKGKQRPALLDKKRKLNLNFREPSGYWSSKIRPHSFDYDTTDGVISRWVKKHGNSIRDALVQGQAAIDAGREKYAMGFLVNGFLYETYARKPASGQMSFGFDESKHPRAAKGTAKGGQFVKGGGGTAAKSERKKKQEAKQAADRAAAEKWMQAQKDYREQKIGDEEFLAAKSAWEENQKAFDKSRGEAPPEEGKVKMVQAPAGGAYSDVTGQFYKGGQWMPVHGLAAGQEKKPKAKPKAKGSAPVAGEGSKKKPQARKMSAEQIAEAKEKKERQAKWDAVHAGPLKDVFWLGEKPGKTGYNVKKQLVPFLTSLSNEQVEKIGEFTKAEEWKRKRELFESNYGEGGEEYKVWNQNKNQYETKITKPAREEFEDDWNELRDHNADLLLTKKARKSHPALPDAVHGLMEYSDRPLDEYVELSDFLKTVVEKGKYAMGFMIDGFLYESVPAKYAKKPMPGQMGLFGSDQPGGATGGRSAAKQGSLFDESKHPRGKKGTAEGGRFVKANEAVMSGKSHAEFQGPASEAFVNEEIDEDHPAYQHAWSIPLKDYVTAQRLAGSHVSNPFAGQKHPPHGVVTGFSDDLKTAFVTGRGGEVSEHSPGNLSPVSGEHVTKKLDQDMYGPSADYMTHVIAQTMHENPGMHIKEAAAQHGVTMGIKSRAHRTFRNEIGNKLDAIRAAEQPQPSEARKRAQQASLQRAQQLGEQYAKKPMPGQIGLFGSDQPGGATGGRSAAKQGSLFDESKHPRGKKGTAEGGRFVKGSGGGSPAYQEPIGPTVPQGAASSIAADRPLHEGATFKTPAFGSWNPWEYQVLKDEGPGGKAFVGHASQEYDDRMLGAAEMPSESLRHFASDLGAHRLVEPSNHPALEAVRSGFAPVIDRGNDGIVFDTGDSVVKMSTTSGFQPFNPGHLSPEDAKASTKREHGIRQALVNAGVPGVLPSEFIEQKEKAFIVSPKLDTKSKLTPEHIEQLNETLEGMHNAGYRLRDTVQAGVGADGRAYIYDFGSAGALGAHEQPDWSAEADHDNLNSLARRHGEKTPRMQEALQRREVYKGVKSFGTGFQQAYDHFRAQGMEHDEAYAEASFADYGDDGQWIPEQPAEQSEQPAEQPAEQAEQPPAEQTGFQLEQEPAKGKKPPAEFFNTEGRQKKLIDTGGDDLEGQQRLFGDAGDYGDSYEDRLKQGKGLFSLAEYMNRAFYAHRFLAVARYETPLQIPRGFQPSQRGSSTYNVQHAPGAQAGNVPFGGGAKKPRAYDEARSKQFNCDWITINASKSAPEGEKGGTPVCLSDYGTVKAGPQALRGQRFGEHAKKATAADKRKQAIESAATNWEIDPKELEQTAKQVWEYHKQFDKQREDLKKQVRQRTGLTEKTIAAMENRHEDHSTLQGFDQMASEMAMSYPELGFDQEDPAPDLWNLLREGRRAQRPLHDPDILSEAADMILSGGSAGAGPIDDDEATSFNFGANVSSEPFARLGYPWFAPVRSDMEYAAVFA